MDNTETFFSKLQKLSEITTLYQYLSSSLNHYVIVDVDREGYKVCRLQMDKNMKVWEFHNPGSAIYPLSLDTQDLLDVIEYLKHDQKHVQTKSKNGEPIFGSRWAEIKYLIEYPNLSRLQEKECPEDFNITDKWVDDKEIEVSTDHKKPLLGVMPKFIWDRKRIRVLSEAICRYADEKLPIPAEWIEEYNRLTEKETKEF